MPAHSIASKLYLRLLRTRWSSVKVTGRMTVSWNAYSYCWDIRLSNCQLPDVFDVAFILRPMSLKSVFYPQIHNSFGQIQCWIQMCRKHIPHRSGNHDALLKRGWCRHQNVLTGWMRHRVDVLKPSFEYQLWSLVRNNMIYVLSWQLFMRSFECYLLPNSVKTTPW